MASSRGRQLTLDPGATALVGSEDAAAARNAKRYVAVIYSSSEGYGSKGSGILERPVADLNCISRKMLAVRPAALRPQSAVPESDLAIEIRFTSVSKARLRLRL